MESEKGPICEDVLENLTFRRCKWWSSFFEFLEECGDGKVYTVHEIDEQFEDNISDEEERENAKEAEEVNAPEDIEQSSILNSITEHGKNSFMELSDVQDILNVTRPILEEHERKWKKAGMERILNTFDSVRIEKEVGGWMRRNHTAASKKTESNTDTDTDSSISCDTGRYIRSIQKNSFKRRGKSKTSIKKFKNSQKMQAKHGMLIEATTYRAYKCNCCKYKMNRPNPTWKSRTYQQQDSTDTDDESSESKLKSVVLTASEQRVCQTRRYVQKYNQSSDSDYASPKNRALVPRGLHQQNTEQYVFNQSTISCGKHLSSTHKSERLLSMIERRYETPTKSSVAATNLINTAPSKVTNKREAAKNALAKIQTINGKQNKPKKKTKPVSMKTQQDPHSSEGNSSFERNLKKAIALSLKSYKKNGHIATTSNKVNDNCSDSEGNSSLSSTETIDSVISMASTDSKQSFRNEKRLPETPKMFTQVKPSEETFLTNFENIYNSTAVNGVAVRKQLISHLPPINESSETILATPRCTGKQTYTCHASTFKPKQIAGSLPSKSKYSTSYSPTPFRAATEFENIYNSTALGGVKVGNELVMTPKPRTMIQSGPHRLATSEPRCRLKQITIFNRRKTTFSDKNNSNIFLNSDRSKKSLTTESIIGAKQTPKRIQLYTPQQKELAPDGYFKVTREFLSHVIGERDARRFFKHHIGRLSFPNTSAVYFCPPDVELSSSDSDDDPLSRVGHCGELQESVSYDERNGGT